MPDKKKVLITDGGTRAALSVVRSLGRAGYSVFVSSTEKRSLGGVSRFPVSNIRTVDPMDSPERWRMQIRSLVRSEGIHVVIPVTDASILAMLETEEPWPASVPFPTSSSFRALSDKAHVMKVAAELGIAVPRQWIVTGPGDSTTEGLPAEIFPLVVKPSRSVVGLPGARTKVLVSYAEDPSVLRETMNSLPEGAFPVLLQEKISGPGIGVFLLVWDGKLEAVFGHRRLREKPPSGGVSVLRESVPVPTSLRDQSKRLLDSVNWRGVAMVEYKMDAVSGTPYLMEVNGRFWGSLQLAVDAGVDFPALLVDLALGNPSHMRKDYDLGVQTQWFWGDVDHLLLVLRGKGTGPGRTWSRFEALRGFLGSLSPQVRREVFSLDDMRPFLLESGQWFLRR